MDDEKLEDKMEEGNRMPNIEKARRLLLTTKTIARGKTGNASNRAAIVSENITEVMVLLDDVEEKTCTLTWRKDGTALADCSNCGEGQLYNDYNYCPNCGARNVNPEDEPIIPSNIQRCPKCNEPYDPKPGVFMVKCLECGADMFEEPSDHPDGEVDIPPEAAAIGMMHPIDEDLLFCNKCNKIIKEPIWDEEIHGPYCPDCKTTLVERSSDEKPEEEVTYCTLTYCDGWALCSNCKGEWVDLPRELDNYKYCPSCGAKVIPPEEPELADYTYGYPEDNPAEERKKEGE